MVPTRATPTIGGSAGSQATRGSTVKPRPLRSGTMSSRPLQMVGVSHWRSASRSALVNAGMVMVGSYPMRGSSPRVELGADASDDDRGIARPHAGRAEDDDAVAHARVVRMDRRIAVLQAFDERTGGQAEHALLDRELD